MKTCRAKMTVLRITQETFPYLDRSVTPVVLIPGEPVFKVQLTAEYDSSLPEDQRFQKATPSGSIELQIDNPTAIEFMRSAKSFYVDFFSAD